MNPYAHTSFSVVLYIYIHIETEHRSQKKQNRIENEHFIFIDEIWSGTDNYQFAFSIWSHKIVIIFFVWRELDSVSMYMWAYVYNVYKFIRVRIGAVIEKPRLQIIALLLMCVTLSIDQYYTRWLWMA